MNLIIRSNRILLPRTGCLVSGANGDDGHLQAGNRTAPTRASEFIDNLDGTVSDYGTGLMWVTEPIIMIPGATGVTTGNKILVAHGNWATGHGYIKGDLVNAICLDVSTPTVAAAASTTVTGTSTNFTSADIGRYLIADVGGTPVGPVRIMAVGSTTSITVASAVTIVAKTFELHSHYVCVADHTSGAGLFTAETATNWRETHWTASAADLTTRAPMVWAAALQESTGTRYTTAPAGLLNYAGYTDWRLPNILEWFSRINFGATNHTYAVFPLGWTGGFFWSSTPRSDATVQAQAILWGPPMVTIATKATTMTYYPWPVRGNMVVA
jgi:hypothetical protein